MGLVKRLVGILVLFISACAADEIGPQYPGNGEIPLSRDGLWITCEGNFGWDNGSLSYYDPTTGETFNQVFRTVNGRSLGDVVQHMSLHKDEYFLTINNSNKIEVIDVQNLAMKRTLGPFDSPRGVYFFDRKGFVTSLWSNDITVIDPETGEVLGKVNMGGWSEKMIPMGTEVWVQVRNGDPGIKAIDPNDLTSKTIFKSPHEVLTFSPDDDGGVVIASDKAGKIILYRHSSAGLDSLETQIPVAIATRMVSYGGDIYLLNTNLYRIDSKFNLQIQIEGSRWQNPYSLWVDDRGIFVADAMDFVQNGNLCFLSFSGHALDSAELRIIPGFMATLQP
ncbi:MAG: hypothetical protein LPK47_11010 [Bacteroidota bacterium]|nr:hypothetical protein [Bacteroidota bacterium]